MSPRCVAFAKILTPNDDSSRHGILVPQELYGLFPSFKSLDPKKNSAQTFAAKDLTTGAVSSLSYRYYQRYPERRVTRINPAINCLTKGCRIFVFAREVDLTGTPHYSYDFAVEQDGARFDQLYKEFFGNASVRAGAFSVQDVGTSLFKVDRNLEELLGKFDEVCAQGWVRSLREGDTGIGYTFETLIGLEENNSQKADFKGIEIKCHRGLAGQSGGKLNLFQEAPLWLKKLSAKERLREIGQLKNGIYKCHSQVTKKQNNLGLSLDTSERDRVFLLKDQRRIGQWLHSRLEERLLEKHSRTVFIRAEVKEDRLGQQFRFRELLYCDRPTLKHFLMLIDSNKILFEFLMREEELGGSVRNRGYPWRLRHEQLLGELFSRRIKLR